MPRISDRVLLDEGVEAIRRSQVRAVIRERYDVVQHLLDQGGRYADVLRLFQDRGLIAPGVVTTASFRRCCYDVRRERGVAPRPVPAQFKATAPSAPKPIKAPPVQRPVRREPEPEAKVSVPVAIQKIAPPAQVEPPASVTPPVVNAPPVEESGDVVRRYQVGGAEVEERTVVQPMRSFSSMGSPGTGRPRIGQLM